MKVLKEYVLPLLVAAFNVGLAARTGLVVFDLVAALIVALIVAKIWRIRRGR